MACDHCQPEMVDYGFQLPDVRETLYEYGPLDDGDDVELLHTIKIKVERSWKQCECEMGMDFDCSYSVIVDGENKYQNKSINSCYAWIEDNYPSAMEDDDDDGEYYLRMMGG